MVILDVKRSEKKNEFLYETSVKAGDPDPCLYGLLAGFQRKPASLRCYV